MSSSFSTDAVSQIRLSSLTLLIVRRDGIRLPRLTCRALWPR
jgi:hypothetical protein